MAVRTRRVWGPVATGAAIATVYTVPADRTLVLRGIEVFTASGGSTAGFEAGVDIGAGLLSFLVLPAPGTGVRAWHYDDRWRVFNPGDVLRHFASGSVSWRSAGYGVLLPGPPS